MQSVQRRPDWEQRVIETIEAARARPYSWGVHDCYLFTADCIEAMTGVDPAAWCRGRYKTRIQAYGLLKRFAGGGLEPTIMRVTAELKMPEMFVKRARRGDWMLFDGEQGDALGIVGGAQTWFVSEIGLTIRPTLTCRKAWAVG